MTRPDDPGETAVSRPEIAIHLPRESLSEQVAKLGTGIDAIRETLPEKERFAIGMIQAVTGASIVAAIAQTGELRGLAGAGALVFFLSTASFALIGAVAAAIFHHEYAVSALKAAAAAKQCVEHFIESGEVKEERMSESRAHAADAERRLGTMRSLMWFSAGAYCVGLLVLVGAMWARALPWPLW